VVRKVERQYVEIAGSDAEPLRVNETSVEAYLRGFSWDHAQYQHQGRQLTELVGQVQAMAGKIEEDLKVVANIYTDKSLALQTTKRKKVVNLVTSDLEDFLSPGAVGALDAMDSDNLISMLVVMPLALEDEFLKTYDSIGATIAAFGGPDWTDGSHVRVGQDDGQFGSGVTRASVVGSPVVPGSARRVALEGEQVMYVVTLLKGQYKAGTIVDEVFSPGEYVDYVEPARAAFREKKLILRDIQYDASKAGGVDAQIEQGEQEMFQVRSKSLRWCKAHFGEAYNGWLHLKMVQAFVESVLRYGLPVDFTAFFLEPNARLEKELGVKLTNTVVQMCPELQMKKMLLEDEEEDADAADNLPYVCLKFNVVGSGN